MVDSRFREQYVDALSVYLRDQEVAGLDIVTDGDCRFDQDIGGQSWTSYPPHHMDGLRRDDPKLATVGAGGIAFPRGHILHDYLEARVMPRIVGPVGRGEMQYAEIWKAAQRLTTKPVKFGTVTPELVAFAVQDGHYKDLPDADHGDQRRVQRGAARPRRRRLPGDPDGRAADPPARGARHRRHGDQSRVHARRCSTTPCRGLRAKTEVWCHTCWGNPSQQRMFAEVQTYKPALELLNQVDADVITFERRSSGAGDLEAIGAGDHREEDRHRRDRPPHAAGRVARRRWRTLVRQALEHIPAERLVLCSDCGMGREGMSRRHAFYKMVSLVHGANIVREELGLPEAECLAADPRFSLIRTS